MNENLDSIKFDLAASNVQCCPSRSKKEVEDPEDERSKQTGAVCSKSLRSTEVDLVEVEPSLGRVGGVRLLENEGRGQPSEPTHNAVKGRRLA